MEKLFKKVDTVFVTVDEMEKSVQWYSDCLGLELLWQNEYISVMGTEGETPVTLMQKDPENEHPRFNFLTENIKQAHMHLKEKGVEVKPIIETEAIKTFDFIDPDGNRLNVCCLKDG